MLLYDAVSGWWQCDECDAEVPVASAEVFAEMVARGDPLPLPAGWRHVGGHDADRRDACAECRAVAA